MFHALDRWYLQANHLSHFMLTNMLLDEMRKTAEQRWESSVKASRLHVYFELPGFFVGKGADYYVDAKRSLCRQQQFFAAHFWNCVEYVGVNVCWAGKSLWESSACRLGCTGLERSTWTP